MFRFKFLYVVTYQEKQFLVHGAAVLFCNILEFAQQFLIDPNGKMLIVFFHVSNHLHINNSP